jgi:hypothetical protein
LIGSFCFVGQDPIECVISRIDNRTIKRKKIFNCNGYLVPLSVSLICICFALSDMVRHMRKP